MFMHFSEREMYIRGEGHLENREKCMPGIPQERKWKLGKMYEAEGGGGPRLYIFKGVDIVHHRRQCLLRGPQSQHHPERFPDQ